MMVLGSANMDIVVQTARAPSAGETVLGESYALHPGGKGANQAVAARRAGAQVSFVGCLGRDAYGEQLANVLGGERIDLSTLQRCDTPTGIALITVETGGENRIIVVPGANRALRLDRVPSLAPTGPLMLAQLEVAPEAVLDIAKRVRQAHGVIVLNPSPVESMLGESGKALLDVTDILVVNEGEARALLGDDADAASAARRLAESRRAAVVTLGAAGAAWCAGDASGTCPGHKLDALDTTGAGDAFAGVFAASIERGNTVGQAVAEGNAAGALAATRRGAIPSLPKRDEIDALMAKQREQA